MGKLFVSCRIQLKFRLRVRLKPLNERGEFELDWAKSKSNIAKNSFALAPDMHSSMHDSEVDVIYNDSIIIYTI